MSGAVVIGAQQRCYGDALPLQISRKIPVESPIAIEINGIAYAVMMATPLDLTDFVTGFLLSEGLADVSEIGPVAVHEMGDEEWGKGLIARVNLPEHRLAPIMDRARRRLGDSACGICGIESVEAALRPLARLRRRTTATPAAVGRAGAELADNQPLGRETGATHAAAFCSKMGDILLVREDVGRHNALDKLIGALAIAKMAAEQGFIIVTSRLSYELVEKTVRAGCPLLVAISAPTDLAVRRAAAAGLTLAVLARDDNMLWINDNVL